MGVTYSSTVARTYEKIAEVIVSSTGSKTITLNSIPQTFDHLIMVCSTRRNAPGAGARGIDVYYNNDSGANQYMYNFLGYYPPTTSAPIEGFSGQYSSSQGGGAFDGNTKGSQYTYYFNDYKNTNFNRNGFNLSVHYQVGSPYFRVYHNTQKSTQALSRIDISEPYEGFVAGDTVTIYGIKGA